MSPHRYLPAFRRYWYVVVLTTLMGALGGWGLSQAATPAYTGTASLYFSLNFGGSANDLNQGSAYTQSQMLSFAQLANSAVVLKPVIRELGLDRDPTDLSKSISVSTPQNTVILDVSVTDPDPARAVAIANSVAASLSSKVEQIAPKEPRGGSSVSVRVIQPATIPQSPSAPNTRLNVLAGLLLGLIIGSLFVVLRELLDTRIRNSDGLEAAGLPQLGTVEREKSRKAAPVLLRDPLSPGAESYRQLRSNLDFVRVEGERLGFVVTSSIPGEGKSLIAANLALALGEGDRRVLLVDADLRRPMVSSYTGLSAAAGLTSVLAGRAEIDDVTQTWGDTGVDVLTAGPMPPNPSELLSSRRMAELVHQLRKAYDVVVFDTPPLVSVADAAILARLLDGALIVADRTKVHRAQLAQAVMALEKSGVSILGAVLNRVPATRGRYRYYQPEARPRRWRRIWGRQVNAAGATGATHPAPTGERRTRRAISIWVRHARGTASELHPASEDTPARSSHRR